MIHVLRLSTFFVPTSFANLWGSSSISSPHFSYSSTSESTFAAAQLNAGLLFRNRRHANACACSSNSTKPNPFDAFRDPRDSSDATYLKNPIHPHHRLHHADFLRNGIPRGTERQFHLVHVDQIECQRTAHRVDADLPQIIPRYKCPFESPHNRGNTQVLHQ